MPQFHVYTTTIYEVVATNIIDSMESSTDKSSGRSKSGTIAQAGKPTTHDAPFKPPAEEQQLVNLGVDGRRGKYSYYMKTS